MTNTTLGQRIAEGRKKLGLSQEAFGDRLGVSRQAASKWESDAAVPEIDKLITMSKLFGVPIGWLLGVEDPEVEPSLSDDQLSAVTELLCRYPTPCPERKNRRWILWACAGGLAACLILGGLGLLFPKHQNTDTSGLEQQLQALSAENDALERKLLDQSTQLDQQLRGMSSQLNILQTELDALKAPQPGIPGTDSEDPPISPDDIRPANELLDGWTLMPEVDTSKNFVTLRFNGYTGTAYHQAELVAVLSGEDAFSTLCTPTEKGFTTELALPCADGYTYYFRVTHDDGTQQAAELIDHGLSDLSSGLQPTVTFSSQQTGNNSDVFWLYTSKIELDAHPISLRDQVITWSDLRISYYCNDELVEEQSVMGALGEQSIHDRDLSIMQYRLVFSLATTLNNSLHCLRLEGSVSSDGVAYTFSIPLEEWAMWDARLVHP